jgi:WD40 repeat protein
VAISIKTQVGFPYSLDISSNNPEQVAIGYGDSVIKVWKCKQIEKKTKAGQQQQQNNIYESTSFWKGLRGQVEKVEWHPIIEGLLAYSTEYGHVGIYDYHNNKCQTMKEHHTARGGTPSITWTGDLSVLLADNDVEGHDTMTDTLITCGGENGDLIIRNASHPNQAPIPLTGLLQTINPAFYTLQKTKQSRCVSISANPMGSYLAIGNNDGSLEIYSMKYLKVVYSSNYHRKKITTLHWKGKKEGGHMK